VSVYAKALVVTKRAARRAKAAPLARPSSALHPWVCKALEATRESKSIEFKEGLDPESTGEWCELTKDVVALANSGGGVIIFGLTSQGAVADRDISPCLKLDPAEFANRISKYIGSASIEFEVSECSKNGKPLLAVVVKPTDLPIAFEKLGTYEVERKIKYAFALGTVYFRRGARSAPGTTDDLRRAFERHISKVRTDWLTGLRRVVEAPRDSSILVVPRASSTDRSLAVRAVDDPTATPVYIVRGKGGAGATFVHEKISGAIFEEINNVLTANRLLANSRDQFVLGVGTYYRVYAERLHVTSELEVHLLLNFSTSGAYAPFAYWMLQVPIEKASQSLSTLFLKPRNPEIHTLMRLAIWAGPEATQWLLNKWSAKWGRHPQPPSFVHTFRSMARNAESQGRMYAALRINAKHRFAVGGNSVTAEELLSQPTVASAFLSAGCLEVFRGDKAMRSISRQLDLIAHAAPLQNSLPSIFSRTIEEIGPRLPAEATEGNEVD
jgi:hypothetical protein